MQEMDELLGHPHRQFKSIHIAGTNGKGSTSHIIASALMRTGLRVGLYTSPHLADFRERMKVNGEMISKDFVYDFILQYKSLFLEKKASFFEITTALAFAWFAQQQVDIAVIECGLGGRLDSTNIITPILSVITNIGLDHCEYLGYTYREIAAEKAGIIKPGVPVVIGERGSFCVAPATDLARDSYVAPVFEAKAAECASSIYFAEDLPTDHPLLLRINRAKMDLQGMCQDKNLKTVCMALEVLYGEMECMPLQDFTAGIEQAAHDTGLRGRWEMLQEKPLVICDTGHNAHGFSLLGRQIQETWRNRRENTPQSRLFMVFGVVADKDLHSIQPFLPGGERSSGDAAASRGALSGDAQPAPYYLFVNAAGPRALPAAELAERMTAMGFEGETAGSVQAGLERALQLAHPEDFIFIGGSTFVVAEVLEPA